MNNAHGSYARDDEILTLRQREHLHSEMQFAMRAFAAYVDCALWCGLDDEERQELADKLRRPVSYAELAMETADKMVKDVLGFINLCREQKLEGSLIIADNGTSLLALYTYIENQTPEQFGHDFWLTRNGYGAGFWDRGIGKVGDELTKWAKAEGTCELYIGDDGLIYCT